MKKNGLEFIKEGNFIEQYKPEDRPTFASVIQKLVEVTKDCESVKPVKRLHTSLSNLFQSPRPPKKESEPSIIELTPEIPLKATENANLKPTNGITTEIPEKQPNGEQRQANNDSPTDSTHAQRTRSNSLTIKNKTRVAAVSSPSTPVALPKNKIKTHHRSRSHSLGGQQNLQVKLNLTSLHNVTIDRPELLSEALSRIFWSGSFSGWVMLGYIDKTTLALQHSSTGGVDQLMSYLEDDQVRGKMKTNFVDTVIDLIRFNMQRFAYVYTVRK